MKQRKRLEGLLRTLVAAAGILSTLLLVGVLVYILVRGLPALQDELLLSNVDAMIGTFSIGIALWNTVVVFLVGFLLSVPIGVGTGIALLYFVPQRPFRKAMMFYADFMASLPGILYGLAGAMVLAWLLAGRQSLLAGAFTLAAMLVPQVLAATIRVMRSYGTTLPLAAVALGSGSWSMLRHVILPECLGQILHRATLVAGHGLGGGAALYFTAGVSMQAMESLGQNLTRSGGTLAVMAFQLVQEGTISSAYAAAVTLVLLVALLHFLSYLVGLYVRGFRRS